MPTAADLLSGLRFKWDPSDNNPQEIRAFHERTLAFIAAQTNPAGSAVSPADCGDLAAPAARSSSIESVKETGRLR
jgi:hypothetical protein